MRGAEFQDLGRGLGESAVVEEGLEGEDRVGKALLNAEENSEGVREDCENGLQSVRFEN